MLASKPATPFARRTMRNIGKPFDVSQDPSGPISLAAIGPKEPGRRSRLTWDEVEKGWPSIGIRNIQRAEA
jgi:hypothetical protein